MSVKGQPRKYAWDITPANLKKASDEAAERKAKQQGFGDGEKLVYLKIEEGENRFRILPGWWGADPQHPRYGDLPFNEVHKWTSIPPFGADKATKWGKQFNNPTLMFPKKAKDLGFKDPVSIMVDRLMEQGVVADWKELSGVGPRRKTSFVCNAYDRKNQKVGILELPSGVYNDIMPVIASYLAGNEDSDGIVTPPVNVFSPYDGRDLVITRVGKDINTKYTPSFASASTPLAKNDDRIEEIMSQARDLDKIYGWPSDKKLAEMAAAAEEAYRWWLNKKGLTIVDVEEEEEPVYKPKPAVAKAAPTNDGPKTFGKGARPCFGNWVAGHRYCFSCPQDNRCKRQVEAMGLNPNAMTPDQAAEQDEPH